MTKITYAVGSATDRPIFWRTLLSGPTVHLPGTEKTWTIDEEFVRSQIDQFRDLTSRGYTPPILKEHRREGTRYGAIVALEGVREHGVWELRAGAHLYEADAWDKVESGQYDYVSGGWVPLKDDAGKEYPNALVEVSLVGAPHVKINQSAASLSELVAMSESENAMEEILKKLEAMEAEIAKLKAAADQTPEEPETPENPQGPQLSEGAIETLATLLSEKLKASPLKPTSMPPQTPDKDEVKVFESREKLSEYARSKGTTVLALMADPNIVTKF